MNLQISKKQRGLIFLVIILMVSLVAGVYYLFMKPLNEQLERKHSELEMANQGLVLVENQLKQLTEKTVISSMKLQKQIPVKRLLDQLLLDIEKAEIISDTKINELKLNGSESDEEVVFKTNENEAAASGNNQSDTENTESADAPKIPEEKLPTGIKKISVTLKGEANTYFEMESFITSLENLKRIVKVDALKFTGLEEIYSVEQKDQPVEFELTIAGYYYPKLEDLRDELPPLDSPGGANKKNPLSSFSEKLNEDSEENQP